MIRALRITVSAVVTAVAIAWLLASCRFGDNRTDTNDAGVDTPSGTCVPHAAVNDCCHELVYGPFGDVQRCLDREPPADCCRWLDCDLVVVSYHYESEACR